MKCAILDHIQNKWYENVEVRWTTKEIQRHLNFTKDSELKWNIYNYNVGTKRKPNYLQFCVFFDDNTIDPSRTFVSFNYNGSILCNSLLIVGFDNGKCHSITDYELSVIQNCMFKKFGRVMLIMKN